MRNPGCSFVLAALGVVGACTGKVNPADPGPSRTPDPPTGSAALAAAPGLRTLTPTQYRTSVQEIIGMPVPVGEVGQWPSAIAAARGGFAPGTVRAYEAEARATARWVFEDADRRDNVVGCGLETDGCLREYLGRVGRRAFRRPLSTEELDRWERVAGDVQVRLGGTDAGAEYALAGLLQSPHFLYRVEIGTASGASVLAFDDYEMATRVAYLLWNSAPDDALLDAAERGDLTQPSELRREVDRMLQDPRFQEGLRGYFGDLLHAGAIETLEKDEGLFPNATPELFRTLRRQLVFTAEAAVAGGDLRSLFTSRTVYLNDALAEIYGLPPTFGPELQPVTLEPDSPRAGILTTPGILAHHAYPGKTSPALRGLFVRKILLCQDIPPPPAGVETTLPEPTPGEFVTTRELVAVHQTEPSCNGCHQFMDPIGLGLENFDALGYFRATQNDLPIDPSGELDGTAFADAAGLGEAIAAHPRLTDCVLENLYAYASGHTVTKGEAPALAAIGEMVVGQGHRMDVALRAIALSENFRFAATEGAQEGAGQ
ncbi:MAG: DUF1592 domain-containing protein [Myxococcota bacterium]